LWDHDLNQKVLPFFVVSLKGGANATDVEDILKDCVSASFPGRYTVFINAQARTGKQRFLEYSGYSSGARAKENGRSSKN